MIVADENLVPPGARQVFYLTPLGVKADKVWKYCLTGDMPHDFEITGTTDAIQAWSYYERYPNLITRPAQWDLEPDFARFTNRDRADHCFGMHFVVSRQSAAAGLLTAVVSTESEFDGWDWDNFVAEVPAYCLPVAGAPRDTRQHPRWAGLTARESMAAHGRYISLYEIVRDLRRCIRAATDQLSAGVALDLASEIARAEQVFGS